MTQASFPVNPILRLPMPMRDGQNPKRVTDPQIGDVMREHLKIDSPVAAGPQAWDIGVPHDPADMLIHFVPEPLT